MNVSLATITTKVEDNTLSRSSSSPATLDEDTTAITPISLNERNDFYDESMTLNTDYQSATLTPAIVEIVVSDNDDPVQHQEKQHSSTMAGITTTPIPISSTAHQQETQDGVHRHNHTTNNTRPIRTTSNTYAPPLWPMTTSNIATNPRKIHTDGVGSI